MDGTFTLGRTSLLCTLLLQVCWASVTVKVTPKVEVIQGESVKLPCTYTTSGKSNMILVDWLIEGAGVRTRIAFRSKTEGKVDDGTPFTGRITMDEDNSLSISGVTVADERAFICQVNGGVIGVSDARTELKVFSAPEEPEAAGTPQLLSVAAVAPEEIGHCSARNGHPQPRIIWYKDASPLPEVKDLNEDMYMVPSVVKESSGLFTINNLLYLKVQKADKDSKFHCVVEYMMPNSAPLQKSSKAFSLNMHYPMEVMTFVKVGDGLVKEGDDVTMKCETDGNPQPTFDFGKVGETVGAGEGAFYNLKKVTRNQAGNYSCSFLDCDFSDCEEISRFLKLSVHYLDPVVIAPAGDQTVKKGEAVELQCKTKASTDYTLVWKKDNKDLSQSGALSMSSVSLTDAGNYSCVGSVPSVPGLVKESSVTLTVSGAPEIEAPTAGEVNNEGDTVTLTCSALGYPRPQITWTPSGKESVDVKGNKMVSTVTLKATAAVIKDGVVCKMSNEHGEDSKTIPVALKTANNNEADGGNRADKQQGGSSGVVIAVVICVLLLLIVVALLYFLQKKGKLPCGKKDKKEVSGREVNNDIVVEMKTGEKGNEESELLNKSAQ